MEVIAMGLLDKVKAQATQVQASAKEAAQKGQAKLDQVQAKRAADTMLHDLGAAFYAQHTDRGTASTQSDIDRLIEALQAHEQANGPIDLTVS
jgi:cob(I)alamin adenosyltransferase